MRRATWLPLILLCCLVTGCIPLAVNPLYTGPGDVVFDPALLGDWQDADSVTRWSVMPEEGTDRYIIRAIGPDNAGQFRGTLVKIGSARFLDLFPLGHEPEINLNFRLHTPPAHSFWRVILEGDTLRLPFVDPGAMAALLEREPEAIEHAWVDFAGEGNPRDRVLLITAESAAFQAFVRDRLTPEFYKNELVMRRVEAEPPPPAEE